MPDISSKLNPQQLQYVRVLSSTLTQSMMFVDAALAEKDGAYYLQVIPKFVFQDMLEDVPDEINENNYTYAFKIPMFLELIDNQKMFSITRETSIDIIYKFLHGNRKLLKVNKQGGATDDAAPSE